jgi:KaiC/GvpD/RAD55 family RecA-like ATPase
MPKPSLTPRLFCFVLVLTALISAAQTSWVYGAVCQVQISGIDYPNVVQLNETVVVTTHLMVTCGPVNDNVVARVDVVKLDTNTTIASNSFGIGTISVTSGAFKIVNVTISNTITSPSTTGTWGLRVVAWVFAGPEVQTTANRSIQLQVGIPIQLTTVARTEITTSQSETNQVQSTPFLQLVNLAIVGSIVLVALAIMGSVMIFRRKSKARAELEVVGNGHAETGLAEANSVDDISLPTGYRELDKLLGGGLPVGRAILFVSQPWDERDLLINKIAKSSLAHGKSVYFLSRDLGRCQDLVSEYQKSKYQKNLYVLTTQADKLAGHANNVFKIADVRNLNDVNISFSKAIDSIPKESGGKIIIMDYFLSDVLLEQKGFAARKWLNDFIARRKSEEFTLIATLNPLVNTEQENAKLIDLFDGVIDIYEKEQSGKSHHFLVVKKMHARKYMETELLLDKDKLF